MLRIRMIAPTSLVSELCHFDYYVLHFFTKILVRPIAQLPFGISS